MRLATWNVNSIRTRLPRVLAFLERTDTDILAIQETKCTQLQFPVEPFEAAGYQVACAGFSAWNGVAVISRVGLADVVRSFPGQPGFARAAGDEALLAEPPVVEARALGATCGGLRVWSLYVPNGRALGDPHYAYKLAWLEALRDAAAGRLRTDPAAQLALVGDWNVIPLDTDVWDPALFAGKTHVSPAERAAFEAFAAAGYTEISRKFVPAEHTYTYWDYTGLSFPRNKGMRIDFAYLSPAAAARATGASIERVERKGSGPSDHAPVIVDFAD